MLAESRFHLPFLAAASSTGASSPYSSCPIALLFIVPSSSINARTYSTSNVVYISSCAPNATCKGTRILALRSIYRKNVSEYSRLKNLVFLRKV